MRKVEIVIKDIVIVSLGGLLLICLAKLQDPIQAQFTDMSAEQRSEFIVWALTPEMRRAVAEDWCATNENTKRVCYNATKGD